MQPITESTSKKGKKPKKAKGKKPKVAGKVAVGRQLSLDDDDDDDDDLEMDLDEDEDEDDEESLSGRASTRKPPPRGPPPLSRVLYANVIIFLYTLPINAFSILLLYAVTTSTPSVWSMMASDGL